ncbi:MAG TPA: 50S ribosomal protein L10 [Guyparkeria sp.]|nr:50S ribosomal protein L10 [Guyparkeria sp.]HZJ81716.1 50S ribosomal protein L10 [Guyparkeria sp.]
MALTFERKKQVVAEVAEVASKAYSAVGVEYRGLTVTQVTELREKARELGVYMRVVKNTLAKRALEGTEYACMNESLRGPLILAFSMDDLGSAARLMKDATKEMSQLEVQFLSLGGELLPASALEQVASLPTREEALAQLMATMQAPVAKLVRTLNEVPGKLVRTVAAVRDQKQAA